MAALFDIDGFTVVLAWVRNVYPVERSKTGWEWGFKFADGFYETFHYKTKKKAKTTRAAFVTALARHWEGRES